MTQSTQVVQQRASAPPRKTNWRRHLEGYLFMSPWMLGFVVLTAGPFVASLVLAFVEWDILRPPKFIGLGNFGRMVADERFAKSFYNTAYYTFIGVPLHVLAALGMALVLNLMLNSVGLPKVPWLISPNAVKPALILMGFWELGVPMVVFLAGLQGVPETLHEAASIDGAGRLRRLIHITIPMISPLIFFNLVYGIIGSFQVFTQALIMTDGGPADATLFVVLLIYRHAFQYFRMGYAAALAWVLFCVVLVFTLIQFRLANRWVYYEGGVLQ